ATCYQWDCSLRTNPEQQWYQAANTSVTCGHLALKVGYQAVSNGGKTFPYTSGMVSSHSSYTFTYGYFEMSAKIPNCTACWPAFWALPVPPTWPPEIDAMESFGEASTVKMTYLYRNPAVPHQTAFSGADYTQSDA